MYIETTLYEEEGGNVISKVSTYADGINGLEAHEGELYKIERSIEDAIENKIDDEIMERMNDENENPEVGGHIENA